MYFEILKKRVSQFKNSEEGRRIMCKAVEEFAERRAAESKAEGIAEETHGTALKRRVRARWKDFELLTSDFENRLLFKLLREDRSRRDDQAHGNRPHDHRQVARAQLHVLHVLHGQKQKRNLKRNPSLGRPVVGPYRLVMAGGSPGRLAPPCGFSRWWWCAICPIPVTKSVTKVGGMSRKKKEN